MAFTKVTNTGIGSTGTVLLQNLDVTGIVTAGFGVSTVDVFTTGVSTFTGDATFSGNVSIGGTLTYEDVTNVDSVGIITARGGVFISAGSSIGIGSATPTADIEVHSSNNTLGILSSTNNGANLDLFDDDTQSRIRTVDGRLHLYSDFKNSVADSNIRFFVDGNNEIFKIVDGGAVVSGGSSLGIGTDSFNSLLTLHQSGGGFEVNANSGSNNARLLSYDRPASAYREMTFQALSYAFETSGVERVRIKSTDGRVGIGSTNPKSKIEVNNNLPSDTGGILVKNVYYGANQDKPYLITGATGGNSWDGTTTNWGTFGFQHKFKSNSGGIPRITIDDKDAENVSLLAGGRVGIGTSAPDARIHVYSNESSNLITVERASVNNATIKYENSVSSMFAGLAQYAEGWGIDDDGSIDVAPMFFVNRTSGKVGIGFTNPTARLEIKSSSETALRIIDSSASGGAPNFEIVSKRSDGNVNTAFSSNIFLGSNRTDQKVADEKILGTVNFGGNHTDGSEDNISYAAAIAARASGDFNSKSDMPTDLIFTTGTSGTDISGESAGSSNIGTERMRITSAGLVGIGQDTPAAQLHVSSGSSGDCELILEADTDNNDENDNARVIFRQDGGADQSAIGSSNNSLQLYNSVPTGGGIDFLCGTTSGYTNATLRMKLHSTGDLSIGTDTSSGRLRVRSGGNGSGANALDVENSDGDELFRVRNDGGLYTGIDSGSPYNFTTTAGVNVHIQSSGRMRRSTSSIRYKKDVTDATWGLTEVLKLKPVTYKSNGTGENADDKTYGGFTAEDIHDLGLTEFVEYNESNQPDALYYANMVALMAKAIQELNAKVVALGG